MRFWLAQHHIRHWLVALTVIAITVLFVAGVWRTLPHAAELIPVDPARVAASASSKSSLPAMPLASQAVLTTAVPAVQSTRVDDAVNPDRVLAALNCARAARQLPKAQRDDQLDQAAKLLLVHVQQNDEPALQAAQQRYAFVGLLLLRGGATDGGCSVGGFDVLKLEQLDGTERIGVALAAVAGTEPYGQLVQAVLLGREQP